MDRKKGFLIRQFNVKGDIVVLQVFGAPSLQGGFPSYQNFSTKKENILNCHHLV